MPKTALLVFAIVLIVVVTACIDSTEAATSSAQPAATKAVPTAALNLTPTPQPTAVYTPTPIAPGTSSYQLSQVDLTVSQKRFNNAEFSVDAFVFADFDRDGFVDAFVASESGTEDGKRVNMFKGIGPGQWRNATAEFIAGEIPSLVSPRKAICADFNNDGYPDIYVADQGFDYDPYPGAKNVLLLSTRNGKLVYEKAHQENLETVGFHHGAAAADIDNDGDIDIFVADDYRKHKYFLINDGLGYFTRNEHFVPEELQRADVFTIELIDIDGDGFIDLFIWGDEGRTQPRLINRIYWGNGTGDFRIADNTLLPDIKQYGMTVDFDAEDINKDGRRDLILTRTGSPPAYYEGFYIQILTQSKAREFTDETGERINAQSIGGDWIRWIRLVDADRDGDVDILTDLYYDASRQYVWLNNGEGSFSLK